jgi:hypothetical protein
MIPSVGANRAFGTVEERLLIMNSTSTLTRVPAHTEEDVNRRIRDEMEQRLAYYAAHGDEIADRLEELNREWDIERTLEANASTLAFAGVVLGSAVDRRWLALPALVTVFLLQHAVQGWCPPLPILRRMGFRTADEINEERFALKALRGDFDRLHRAGNKLAAIWRAVSIARV